MDVSWEFIFRRSHVASLKLMPSPHVRMRHWNCRHKFTFLVSALLNPIPSKLQTSRLWRLLIQDHTIAAQVRLILPNPIIFGVVGVGIGVRGRLWSQINSVCSQKENEQSIVEVASWPKRVGEKACGIWSWCQDPCYYVLEKQQYIYLPIPPLGQDMTQGQFLSGVLQVWIQTSCLTKAEEPSLPFYLPFAGGRNSNIYIYIYIYIYICLCVCIYIYIYIYIYKCVCVES